MNKERTQDTMEKLSRVDAADYRLDVSERITAQAVQIYLGRLPGEAALKLLQGIMKDTVINLPGKDGEAEPQVTEVEGGQLAALIDLSIGDFRDRLEEQSLLTESDEAAEMLTAVADCLNVLNGKLAVENVSADFLTFIMECYKALRNDK